MKYRAAGVLAMVLAFGGGVAQASAAETQTQPLPSYCTNDVEQHLYWKDSLNSAAVTGEYRSFGTDVPVILVHGVGGCSPKSMGLFGRQQKLHLSY